MSGGRGTEEAEEGLSASASASSASLTSKQQQQQLLSRPVVRSPPPADEGSETSSFRSVAPAQHAGSVSALAWLPWAERKAGGAAAEEGSGDESGGGDGDGDGKQGGLSSSFPPLVSTASDGRVLSWRVNRRSGELEAQQLGVLSTAAGAGGGSAGRGGGEAAEAEAGGAKPSSSISSAFASALLLAGGTALDVVEAPKTSRSKSLPSPSSSGRELLVLVADDCGGARVLSAQLSSNSTSTSATTAFPTSSSSYLSPPLTAAAWSPKHRGVFLTAGGDGKLRLWDRRDFSGVSERGKGLI